MLEVLGIHNFRLLWSGQATSLLGDVFHGIAAPWLVLTMTNDPLALGTVLALGGIPRAILILVGGAITDRFSPRSIMLASDILRLMLTASLAVLTFAGAINLWLLYGFSLAFGIISAFFWPASGSIMPTLVDEARLQPANALSQSTTQLIMFLGPALAAFVIGGLGASSNGTTHSLFGIGCAFAVDALSFVVSVVSLWLIIAPRIEKHAAPPSAHSVLADIRAGLVFAWHDPLMRLILIVMTVINFLFIGPIEVGIPVLAKASLPEGIIAFGIISAAYSGGNLVGILLAGAVRQTKGLDLVATGVVCMFGVGAIIFGFLSNTWLASLLFLIMGVGNGYISIILITFLQRRTPSQMLGRVMSLVALANIGLGPISQALSGAIVKLGIAVLFVAAGLPMVLTGIWMAFQPALKMLDGHWKQALKPDASGGD